MMNSKEIAFDLLLGNFFATRGLLTDSIDLDSETDLKPLLLMAVKTSEQFVFWKFHRKVKSVQITVVFHFSEE